MSSKVLSQSDLKLYGIPLIIMLLVGCGAATMCVLSMLDGHNQAAGIWCIPVVMVTGYFVTSLDNFFNSKVVSEAYEDSAKATRALKESIDAIAIQLRKSSDSISSELRESARRRE